MDYPTVDPNTIIRYNAEHAKVLERVLSIIDSSDWKKIKEDNGVTFLNRYESDSPYAMLKSSTLIPASMEAVMEKLSVVEHVKDKDGFKLRETFGEVGGEHLSTFMYVAVESGSRLVSNRDFVMYRRHYKRGNKEIFLHVSVDNNDLKPEDKAFVRGFMNFQGYIAEPTNGGILLTFFVHTDPKGSIPAVVYNAACTKQGYAVQKIANAVLGK